MTEVRPARDADEIRAALALRHEVFVVEQRVPLDEEVDAHDETALHLVAVDDGAVVAGAHARRTDRLRHGDELALLTPVAGG